MVGAVAETVEQLESSGGEFEATLKQIFMEERQQEKIKGSSTKPLRIFDPSEKVFNHYKNEDCLPNHF